jgi:hypothetical protein
MWWWWWGVSEVCNDGEGEVAQSVTETGEGDFDNLSTSESGK